MNPPIVRRGRAPIVEVRLELDHVGHRREVVADVEADLAILGQHPRRRRRAVAPLRAGHGAGSVQRRIGVYPVGVRGRVQIWRASIRASRIGSAGCS